MTNRRSGDVPVRQAQPSDAPQWHAMRHALWPDEDDLHAREIREYFEHQPRALDDMPEAVLVAEDPAAPGVLLGFVELTRRRYAEGCETSPVGFLEGWYVVPDARRRGVGRALIQASLDWARSLGCREFASDALADNVESQRAHLALGFEEVDVIRTFRRSIEQPRPGEP